jgi:Tol biopolymer transport system component
MRNEELDDLLKKIEVTERKRRRRTLLYLLPPIFLAGLLVGYTVDRVQSAESAKQRAEAQRKAILPPGGVSQFGRIVFERQEDSGRALYVMNADGSGVTRLTRSLAGPLTPAWSPDSKRIAYTLRSNSTAKGQIYAMNANGSDQPGVNLSNNAVDDSYPAWSPDGNRIAFRSKRDSKNQIYVMNADGSNQIRLSRLQAQDSRPAWSPDGRYIAFIRTTVEDNAGANQIYVMNENGAEQRALTDNRANNSAPAWSPDGTRIAFRSNLSANTVQIYVMNADGSRLNRLSNDAAQDMDPTWSPTGIKIAFRSDGDPSPGIFVMNADGSGRTPLTGSQDFEPAWGLA